MANEVTTTIHFMDGTKMSLAHPRQAAGDAIQVTSAVRKALDSDKIVAEIQGDLFVIPVRNIKYVQVTPAPKELPQGVLIGAQITRGA
ncbi:MAG: hypothetical protein HN849_26480 [Victivallales bacterium]|jgi:hypothetical protein|nr:hypothetical protein [Victivallales bacterium]